MIEVINLARKHTVKAIRTLVTILENGESEQARIAAANALLDRAWGKAPQSITIDDQRDVEGYSDPEVEGELVAIRAKAAARIGAGELEASVPARTPPVVH